jgi:hypothetical protein
VLKKLVLAVAGTAGAAGAGWVALVKAQGDSLMVYEPEALSSVSWSADGRSAHGEITIVNRGKVGGVVHKVFGRVVAGPPGRVLVTRKGSRPPERGWWQSNCLLPGESCVAEVDVELEAVATGPVTVEIDTHEIGRRLVVHRTAQLTLAAPREDADDLLRTPVS